MYRNLTVFAYLYSGIEFDAVIKYWVPKTNTMSGGLSFFSPRVGFVCNNILSYEIVLANGTLATASETVNPGLWRALKGGSNNFGIVTKFVARSFPSAKVWAGFLYMTSSKVSQLIDAFHQFTESKPGVYDEYAAGPLVCFSYVQKIGIRALSTYLVYTKPEKWPKCYDGFKSIGRIWSTVKIRSLTSATNELDSSSPPGLRFDIPPAFWKPFSLTRGTGRSS